MSDIEPRSLFELIAAHVPADLHPNLLLVGSLAAAYHHRSKLTNNVVKTKDADVLVTPAAAVNECRAIALRLLGERWRRIPDCHSMPRPEPPDQLRAIRLNPPKSEAYFIELLALAPPEQTERLVWIPCELDDGWYGLPSHRFLRLAAHDALPSHVGIRYADSSMMALANLLSHPTLGVQRIEKGDAAGFLRSAKDLGRVLALAFLAERGESERWAEGWAAALRVTFPAEAAALAAGAGDGLRELLADRDALDEARQLLSVSLLAGYPVTSDQLAAIGRQLLLDAIDPLADSFG